MTEILLIRHGETDWNRVRRMQGHIDIGLNSHGRLQAQALAKALAGEPPAAIYASDLQRARDTAQAVADIHGMSVHIEIALRERCYGAFEGLRYDDISQHFPEAFAQWRARDPHARFPSGEREAETAHEFYLRSVAAVLTLAKRHPGEKILVLTHGGVLDSLYRAAQDMSLQAERNFEIKNAAINRLQWDAEQLRVIQWAQTAHLASLSLDEL